MPAVLLVLILFLWLEPILSTLAPFALAFVFAYLLNPVVDFLSGENRKKWRMHRGFALLILFLVLLLAVLGILGVVIPSIAEEAAEFGRKMRDEVLPIIRERVGERREVWLPYTQAEFWVDLYTRYQAHFTFENLVKVLTYGWQGAGAVAERAGGVWSWLSGAVGGFVSFLVFFSLVGVIMFYMLLDFAAFKKNCYNLVPDDFRPRFKKFMGDVDRSVGGFIRGQATVCAIVGSLVGISMALLGVPFALPIGLGVAIFGFIPYLGPVIGITPAILFTVLESFEPGQEEASLAIRLGLVVGVFLLIQMAEGFLISPKVMAESVDVSPLVVMGTLMLGGSIAGVTGMVLAIPVYCVLRVLVKEYRKEVSALEKPLKPSPPAPKNSSNA